ncbi:uncharacterized protein METZ01_LOCUS39246 [marine metagenome]|jgi:hypothetical protein|uniref:Uncharacterized protein n=1 Tax=marine metagenome TaxID=408172 RepID=A0A381R3W7_9ZZZZ|tara:strand:- start:4085 stop:4351 length:267 start_codon:yes stop_codon:yes gene_type:complete
MVKEATTRQLVISIVKKKIYGKYVKYTNGKSGKGDDELMRDFINELTEFQILIQENDDENLFYRKLVSFNGKNFEEYMTLLVKYNKLF